MSGSFREHSQGGKVECSAVRPIFSYFVSSSLRNNFIPHSFTVFLWATFSYFVSSSLLLLLLQVVVVDNKERATRGSFFPVNA